jgi:hypothetical protein
MWFWYLIFWIAGTVALFARAISIWKNPHEGLSPLTFIIVGFFWLYIVGYLTLDPWDRTIYLSEQGYFMVLLLASLSAFAFWFGFRRQPSKEAAVTVLHEGALKFSGIFLIALGSGGWFYFLMLSGGFFEYYSAPHGAAGAWENTTAYLYGTLLLLFPGAFILLALSGNRRPDILSSVALLWSVAFVVLDAWLAGQRSNWLRLGVLLGVFFLFLRGNPSRSRVLPAALLAIIIAIVLVTPYLREAVYFGAEQQIGEALAQALETLVGLSEGGPGHELIYASALVESADQQGAIDFGYHWLHPLLNVVPRAWWPEKPYVTGFSISYDELLWQSPGWVTEKGSVPTGIADAFLRFYWISPVVWFFIGSLGGRYYGMVKDSPNVVAAGYFTAYLYGLIHAITQEFINALYAFLFMAVPLYLAFSLVRWAHLVGRKTSSGLGASL